MNFFTTTSIDLFTSQVSSPKIKYQVLFSFSLTAIVGSTIILYLAHTIPYWHHKLHANQKYLTCPSLCLAGQALWLSSIHKIQ